MYHTRSTFTKISNSEAITIKFLSFVNRKLKQHHIFLALLLPLGFFDLVLSVTRNSYPFFHMTPIIQRAVHNPGGDSTFAQNFQDIWFVSLARANNWDSGYYLDIGAYSGIWCSNSALLDFELKYSGISVEPFPTDFGLRNSEVVVKAMGDVEGKEVSFGGVGQMRLIKNDDGSVAPSLRGGGAMFGGAGLSTMITFPELLKQYEVPQFINLLSLDVEGLEYPSLLQFPFDEFEVGAFIIENGQVKRAPHGREIVELMEKNGYRERLVENRGVDGYFVKDKYWGVGDELLKKGERVHPFGSWGC